MKVLAVHAIDGQYAVSMPKDSPTVLVLDATAAVLRYAMSRGVSIRDVVQEAYRMSSAASYDVPGQEVT